MDSCKTCEEEPASHCQHLLQEVGHRRLSEDSEINVDSCFNVKFCTLVVIGMFADVAEEVRREQSRQQPIVQAQATDVRKVT